MFFFNPRPLLQAFCCALALLASSVWGAELRIERAFFQDRTRALTLDEVKTKPLKPYEGILSLGYIRDAVWIKIDITPPPHTQADDRLILLVKPIFLDDIRLYDPLDTGAQERRVGDTVPFSQNEFESLYHTFVIPAGEAPRSVWLRVVTTSTTLVNVQVFPFRDMQHEEFESQMAVFLVLALMSLFLLHVLISWTIHRDPLEGFFVVRQLFFLGFTATLFGLHRYLLHEYVSPAHLDALFSWLVICATLVTFLFERNLLSEYKPNALGRWITLAVPLMAVVALALLALGFTHEALTLNLSTNFIGLLAITLTSVLFTQSGKTLREENPNLLDKRWLIGYYAVIASTMLLSSMPSLLGLMEGNTYTTNALVYYALISGGLMTVLMQLRTKKMIKARRDSEQNLILSQQQAWMEKQRRQEQAHLLHMLVHELKNPLAIIEMAQHAHNDKDTTANYISRSVKIMREVIDRCIEIDKLEEGNEKIELQTVDLVPFIHECLREGGHAEDNSQLALALGLSVRTDAQFLKIMLMNLLDNARRYGDPLVPMEISAERAPNAQGQNGVAITVSNRPGKAHWPDAQRIFTKYYRSKGAESLPGTGLGLYLVRTVAQRLGGGCRYIPDDKHIRFELWLPS